MLRIRSIAVCAHTNYSANCDDTVTLIEEKNVNVGRLGLMWGELVYTDI